MAKVLLVRNLTKRYPGGVEALKGVSFEVEEGEIVALIGPNGAGKTTTFRIIAGLLKPTSGEVILDGIDVVRNPLEARKRLVYVPEEVGGYRRLKGIEYLSFAVNVYMSARGATPGEISRALEEAVRLAGLPMSDLNRMMEEYSKGMKRRVQVAWALAVKPRLVLLDEPTVGLDVEASFKIRMTIRRYAKEHGITVLLSSHNMLEVETLADRVILLNKGVIVDEGSPDELKRKYNAVNLEEVFMRAIGVEAA